MTNQNGGNRVRGCDVCGSAASDQLYRQEFRTFDDQSGLTGYRVVACARCGFLYADGIPAQHVFDSYYRDMSKYEPAEDASSMAPGMRRNYELIVSEISQRLPDRNIRILDVGSASGDLLSIFREHGYANLTGLDPSPRCAEVAMRRHGLRVVTAPISEMHLSGERFDLILLAGVLEHLRDLLPTLRSLETLLAPGGYFWFGIPDAGRFPEWVESPFQHFSLEHINFFTVESLKNLMAAGGQQLVSCWETTHRLGAMNEPIINALFKKTDVVESCTRDRGGIEAARRYIAASAELERRLFAVLDDSVPSGEQIVIWGTGSLTMHLLADERMKTLDVAAFVDLNQNYWGKTIGGIPLIPPAAMHARAEAILLASYAYEAEMRDQIRDVYGLPNPVIPLFERVRLRGDAGSNRTVDR